VAPTHAAVAGTSAVSEQAGLSGSSGAAPLSESAVDTPAKLRSGTPPAYTAQALSAGIEQDVPLQLVIDPSGAVLSARALVHVGYGLDDAALRSVQSYRFTPARRSGRPVAVRMRWVMRFQLQ
ncbi:MAG TPA: energy transducer TonB, partial [Polyangiaceae bacterium]|nr:energy transducer TonB [Polyangiaceae bacterium]